jgi:protein-S-isoprenylcysteine O-methyltransferase Ste14
MPTSSASNSAQKVSLNKYGYNTIARNMSIVVITCVPLFLAAGTWSRDWAWVYTAASLIGWTVLNVIVAVKNPELFNQRGKPTRDLTTGAKKWDLILLTIYTILLFVVPIVAGLDFRYGWSGDTSPLIHILGIVLLLLGLVPLTWAMAANKYFEPTVRIQTEAGHQVAENGPYRFVRHPGYLGVILHFIAVPLALGAWAALIPALLGAAIYVVRTALEDKTLRQELPGYADFAERIRFRLLPGIW